MTKYIAYYLLLGVISCLIFLFGWSAIEIYSKHPNQLYDLLGFLGMIILYTAILLHMRDNPPK